MTSVRPIDVEGRSLWLREALHPDEMAQPALVGETKTDIAIVGGGYLGLWTAIRLKQARPELSIAIIERDICGGGASGRNGGFAMSWWSKFLALHVLCGSDEAVRLARASEQAVSELGTFCAAHAPEADFRQDGWLWAATNEAQIDAWRATLEQLERHGLAPFRRLSPEETAQLAGSDVHLAGVLEPTVATVQPAILARALMRHALALGVDIYENSPMTGFQGGAAPMIQTPTGRLSAQKIVLATNAWSIALPVIRQAILVTSSDIIATNPVPERLAAIGRDDGLAISDSRMMVHYYRTTKNGRFIFGKGGGSGALAFGGKVGEAFEGASPLAEVLRGWLAALYPDLGSAGIAASWTGPIDKSYSGLPFFGTLPGQPGICFGVGFSGNGVGPTVLGSRILAALVLERDDEWANTPLVRRLSRDFPPEPWRYLGGQLVRRAVAAKDSAEDQGRVPGLLTRRLAALAPAGLSPIAE